MASHVNTAPTHQSQLGVCVCVCVLGVLLVVICVVSYMHPGVFFHVSPCCALTSSLGQCVLIGLMTDWCIIHHSMERVTDDCLHETLHVY